MSKPQVSIIVPTLDPDSKRVRNLLADLAALPAKPTRELCVAAYGGTFAQNVNRAAQEAQAPELILLNDDLRLTGDLVYQLWAARPIHTSMVAARLLYPNGLIQHAGIGLDMNGNPYNLWEHAPAEHPAVMQSAYPMACTFAAVLITRSLWQSLGGLDEGYQNAYEDLDFCLRAREHGAAIRYKPTASAVHLVGQTPGRHDHDAESWAHFRQKWLDTGRLWATLGVYPFSVQRGGN